MIKSVKKTVYYKVERCRRGVWQSGPNIYKTEQSAEREMKMYLRSYAPEDVRIVPGSMGPSKGTLRWPFCSSLKGI